MLISPIDFFEPNVSTDHAREQKVIAASFAELDNLITLHQREPRATDTS